MIKIKYLKKMQNIFNENEIFFRKITFAREFFSKRKKKAKKLRVSVSEFIRKRVLDYELKPFPSNAYFTLCEKIEGLIANPNSPRFKQEVIDCLDIISEELWR